MQQNEVEQIADGDVLRLPLVRLGQKLRERQRLVEMLLDGRPQRDRVDRLELQVAEKPGLFGDLIRMVPVLPQVGDDLLQLRVNRATIKL